MSRYPTHRAAAFKLSGTNTSRLLSILAGLIALAGLTMAQSMITFDTNFVELDTSKMVHTSDNNYAISSDRGLPSGWQTVSVNGDEVTIALAGAKRLIKNLGQLTRDERSSIEALKSSLTQIIRNGPFNVRSQTGLAKITTFDRNGGSSSMSSGGGGSSAGGSSSSSSSSSGGTSVQKTGPDSFIVSKQNFPFNWHRLFFNNGIVTIVYRSSRVLMLPQGLIEPNERAKVDEVRAEALQSSRAAEDMTRQFAAGAFSSPMDFVSKAMSGMFGR